jgi:hypothetical protein
MIPWIKETYPDLYVLVGSTLDDDTILGKMRDRHPQLLTLEELADMGVDGFVSMSGWRNENIRKYAPTHLVMPTAMTIREAIDQVSAGAQFIKVLGPDLNLVKILRGDGVHGFAPIMITGGMSKERIPLAIEAGVTLVGSGFEILLGQDLDSVSTARATSVIKEVLTVAQDSRRRVWPNLLNGNATSPDVWLRSLPHYHPF